MGPIVIYYHVNIMDNDFKLARQGLNEFVHPGHKGLKLRISQIHSFVWVKLVEHLVILLVKFWVNLLVKLLRQSTGQIPAAFCSVPREPIG